MKTIVHDMKGDGDNDDGDEDDKTAKIDLITIGMIMKVTILLW